MDYLDEPGGRQRAMSVASILTNTMEGKDQTIVLNPSCDLSVGDIRIILENNDEM